MANDEVEKALKIYESSEATTIGKKAISIGITAGIAGLISRLTMDVPILGAFLSGFLYSPIQDGIELISGSRIGKKQEDKRKKLEDAIINCGKTLTPEEIEEINGLDFIIEYGRVQEVLDRLARDDKVNFITNLFCKYFIEEHNEQVDQFEEALNQLVTLSYREIRILIRLNKIEKDNLNHDNHSGAGIEKDLFPIHEKSTEELISMSQEWSLTENEMIGLLLGLTRSGFIREDTATRVGYEGGVFYTTDYFEKFLNYILTDEERQNI